MGTRKVLWSLAGKLFSVGVLGLCVSDCVASVAPVRGSSMSPTFNPQKTTCMGISTGWSLRKHIAFRAMIVCLL